MVPAAFCSTPWIISAPKPPNFTSQAHRNTTPIGTISPKEQLFGIEVNESIARVAKMNMIIHDDGHSNVIGNDALVGFDTLYTQHREFEKETFDLILTNPPFGAVVKKVESPYLDDYELGKGNEFSKDRDPVSGAVFRFPQVRDRETRNHPARRGFDQFLVAVRPRLH